jgi:outer membrane scaffolding protein for murein synthesis (MipA/OmpV family)
MARIALLILATGPALAQDDLPATPSVGLHGSVGLSVGVRPEYDGARDSKTVLMPTINLLYGDSLFFTRMTAGANLLRYKTEQGLSITAGPLLGLRRGRDQDDHDALRVTLLAARARAARVEQEFGEPELRAAWRRGRHVAPVLALAAQWLE